MSEKRKNIYSNRYDETNRFKLDAENTKKLDRFINKN